MGSYVTDKKNMRFQSLDALQQVVNVVNDAAAALNDPMRTIRESAIPEVVTGAVGTGLGGAISFTALYGLGTVGLSAPGITSGLAAAGVGLAAITGMSNMVAGIFVLATPVAGLAAAGVGIAAHLKDKQLKQEKERLYQEVLKKHTAIIKELQSKLNMSEERRKYLEGLNILLIKACTDLKHDLGYAG